MEPVLSRSRRPEEDALAEAVEALCASLRGEPPPAPDEVRRALAAIAELALAAYPDRTDPRPPPADPSG